MVKHLCQWLRVSIDYGPTNHPRAQGAVERVGGWLQEVLSELSKSWPRIWDRFVLPHAGSSVSPQILAYPRLRHHSVYCSAGMPAHSWTRLCLSSMVWNIKGDCTLSWRTNNKRSERYTKP